MKSKGGYMPKLLSFVTAGILAVLSLVYRPYSKSACRELGHHVGSEKLRYMWLAILLICFTFAIVPGFTPMGASYSSPEEGARYLTEQGDMLQAALEDQGTCLAVYVNNKDSSVKTISLFQRDDGRWIQLDLFGMAISKIDWPHENTNISVSYVYYAGLEKGLIWVIESSKETFPSEFWSSIEPIESIWDTNGTAFHKHNFKEPGNTQASMTIYYAAIGNLDDEYTLYINGTAKRLENMLSVFFGDQKK